ncbi:alpha/beta hydrolase [Mycobacterium sp. M26]|uniref:alpha/beta fold hydrolase n=1 Tax=Mycobacterium sp. M26 TaxID=1762962 RepID=UPI000ACABF69|nr:alpha/beta hydrolase [Mycobacterium sp. M26]
MDLFVRESGPVEAPAIVFLHGGIMSGWSWDPVVARLQHYRCLVPDLPQYGKSFEHGPFDMANAAMAIAALIRSRAGEGRAHIVGFSLGAQVAVQLLATQPDLVDRAVLSGTFINMLPGVSVTRRVVGILARTAWFRWLVINRHWHRHDVPLPMGQGYLEDARLNAGAELAHIVEASAGFTLPARLGESHSASLFLSGSEENILVRRWATLLAASMPNGVDMVATGVRHDWPHRHPELFARTVDSWLSQTPLPSEIRIPSPGSLSRSRDLG